MELLKKELNFKVDKHLREMADKFNKFEAAAAKKVSGLSSDFFSTESEKECLLKF